MFPCMVQKHTLTLLLNHLHHVWSSSRSNQEGEGGLANVLILSLVVLCSCCSKRIKVSVKFLLILIEGYGETKGRLPWTSVSVGVVAGYRTGYYLVMAIIEICQALVQATSQLPQWKDCFPAVKMFSASKVST